LAKTISAAEREARKKRVEEHRQREYAKASADWDRLTKDKDEWPPEEHEARFEALVRKALFVKPIK
jgi:hypothetical protein